MKNRLRSISTLTVAVFLTACIKLPPAPPPDQSTIDIPDYEKLVPGNSPTVGLSPATLEQKPGSSFQQELAQQGIKLSATELQLLQQLARVRPNGSWAASQTRSEDENLKFNFQRFGSLLQPPPVTAEYYKQRAIDFAKLPGVPLYLDVQYYQQKTQLLVVKWDSQTWEFVILRPDGTLVNYLTSRTVGPPRYLQIANFW